MLIYRFPGEAIVHKKGYFKHYNSIDEINEGFVLKSFNKPGIYHFTESVGEDDHYYEGNLPKETSKDEYLHSASQALIQLKSGNLQKVVISRVKSTPFNLSEANVAFEKLTVTYPNAFVYLFSSPDLGTWFGATPEVFLKRTEKQVTIASLAGTKQSSDEEGWREKEYHEQRLVTDYIATNLEEIGATNIQVNGPAELIAGPVKHLFTEVFGETEASTNRIIDKIHPTPAVAGIPKVEAMQFIDQTEQHDRDLYTGVIGYYSATQTKLYVNLRCAQLGRNQAFLYVGGGLTPASEVNAEWEETENKARTLEKILHFE